jgi:hypothetical protein
LIPNIIHVRPGGQIFKFPLESALRATPFSLLMAVLQKRDIEALEHFYMV